MSAPLDVRRARKDRLLKLAERHRYNARRWEGRYNRSAVPRQKARLARIVGDEYARAWKFELAAWEAFGAPM